MVHGRQGLWQGVGAGVLSIGRTRERQRLGHEGGGRVHAVTIRDHTFQSRYLDVSTSSAVTWENPANVPPTVAAGRCRRIATPTSRWTSVPGKSGATGPS